jgi:hypothetical protein
MKRVLVLLCVLCLGSASIGVFAQKLVRADGARYEGQVVDGKAQGQGVETLSDGTVLKGRFANDVFVEGTMKSGGWVVLFSNCHSTVAADSAKAGKD